ncbi:unnamed protein product [Peronospora belbahrii]|uniref:ubiquitinyl hydrolase 1 n=1 Tax=Peronospora belbahrii TaxID=622444 RepID=A0ABN8D1K6_9STRA|nr:unnamed protein product [Peronospora belbahrii]
MVTKDILNQIFRLKHETPSNCQDAAVSCKLATFFAAFATSLKATGGQELKCSHVEPLTDDRIVAASLFTTHEIHVLQQLAQRLTTLGGRHERGDVWYDPWLPMYGCVLQRTSLCNTRVRIEVVFVDGWERTLHFLPSGDCVHSAVSKTQHVLHCADLDTKSEAVFSENFPIKLREAQNCKGSDRSAAKNKLGHQKTPQFIAAVVRRTVNSLGKEVNDVALSDGPRGGTTDVGLHTGGQARDTCWAVVQAVIAHNLCCEPGLFRKTMVAMKLKLLQGKVTDAERDFSQINLKTGCTSVDDLVFMLQVIVENIVELFECGYDVSSLEEQCRSLRLKIDGFVDVLNRQTAEKYCLPRDNELNELTKLSCGAKMIVPKRVRNADNDESKEERRQRAWNYLKGCFFVHGASCSLNEVLQWSKNNDFPASYKCILILRTFEAFMFEKALQLNGDGACNQRTGNDALNLKMMQTLVSQYGAVVRSWQTLPRMTSVLDVEQRSREMLVVWIAFCIVHQQCVSEVPLCGSYNISLEWRDLKVAVLSDQAAISALQHVAQYIRTWNNTTQRPPLFHLTNQEPTFDFGLRYGLNSTNMLEMHRCENKNWEARVKAKWNKVITKKRRAVELRAEISRLNVNLSSNKCQLASEDERLRQEKSYLGYRDRQSHLKTQLMNDINQIECRIRTNERELTSTLDVPRFLRRPLPPARDDAIQVIFMLIMPRNIEILGSLCLTAQRSLTPRNATGALPTLSSTTWQEFYSQNAPTKALRATSKVFTPSPAPFSIPSSCGPITVDDLYNISQYRSECVWNPTFAGTALTWVDAIGMKVNPFDVLQSSVITTFIEKMPQSLNHIQWMNDWPDEGGIRGNMVYANLHQQPKDFERVSFIVLGSLRAFPNQQFRKLHWALLEDVLPWSNLCVEMIVRQSLYQVGTLTDELNPHLLWKSDMFNGDRGLESFCVTLEGIASKIRQTPRNFESVPLLSELAGFTSQYWYDARVVVKMFAGMARRWAKDARVEYEQESSPCRIAEIRRKECVLYGFALLSYSLGPWNDEAAQEVCEMIVLFRTSFLCASINMTPTKEMMCTESKIAETMSRRVSELISYVQNHDIDTILTGLMRLVSATSPGQLKWRQFSELPESGQFGSCFEASDESTNVHYSINLFTGIVLTDGYAPGGLPFEIREHKSFQSLFGNSNFEVFSTNGVLRLERKYVDRLYDFALEAGSELFVQELTVNADGDVVRTLQICAVSWVEALSEQFPAQLWELYSHWYWVEQNCVLFRPKEAKHREVYFIATFDDSDTLQCYKIPFNDIKRPYDELMSDLTDYDRFVAQEESLVDVLRVLTKFEDAQFLHSLRSSKGVLMIELPRFKLTFYLNSNMQFESVENKGYILAKTQQFNDFLPRFRRYLLLDLKDKSDISRPELRMLVPLGLVEESSDGMVDIRIDSNASTQLDVACYDIHRRLKTFETETIGARLQLAAVCARAGTNVPSKLLNMTGEEMTAQILRACRSTRPFSASERDALLSIYKLSYREPVVKILVVALLTEADRQAFLFGQTETSSTINTQMGSSDEKTEYADMCMRQVQRNPLRAQLRNDEERIILGHVRHLSALTSTKEVELSDSLPVTDDYVKSIEKELQFFLQIEADTAKKVPLLPLDSSTKNTMGREMLQELQVSWNSYHSQIEPKLKNEPGLLLGSFETLLSDVSSQRAKMETYLWESYTKATSSTRDRLLSLANFVPVLTVCDIVRCGFDEETLHTLVPKLSEKSRKVFSQGILQYMELCVLEDKVKRLIWIASRSGELSDAQLIDELANIRQWESTEFPYWLAFEVEGRLQIRHEQFVIARHLIDRQGTVCQLNMGRGKTRVILPMLFLYFTRRRSTRVVRAHFLSPLLSEARQFMHRYLSATSARLGVFEQPFHRQVELNSCRLELMRDTLDELKLFGGIQMVAPEHRMSLELKRLEMGNDKPMVEMLDKILDSDQFVDVMDECDALLHHKYHLVYAVGVPIPLDSGVERWMAAEALLRVVADTSSNSRVRKVLQAPHVSCISLDYATRLGSYEGTRLNTVVDSTELLRDELKEALVLDLIDSAPFELMWLNAFGSSTARQAIVTAISDSKVSVQDALGDHILKLALYTTQLLALRGLVAFGVFEHCMEKRYRVDFGLPVPGTRQKKIAIPFRAADVPSERSEFSHPDVCIVLTLLAYYHNGMTKEEIKQTFQLLLRLDISEQNRQYNRWFDSVKLGLNNDDRMALSDVRHISLADARQFEMLYRVYKFCMEAINFYLNTCVFPNDTQQYPQRLSRTAWNLAAGDHNIGFSGTNDNHRLLPLSVTQKEPNEPSLLGTNGKMIDKILQVTHSYEVVTTNPERAPIPWQSVLLFALNKKAQALIDTGALLAGVSNNGAADFLLQQPDFDFAGVTYFDSRGDLNCWMIAEKTRRIKVPLKKASMLEKETFVIFDEARSRGSDMKLLPNAAAVLTLGPKLTKDKLMQGAGRMRQLGCNQTLWIASFDEVAQSILQTSGQQKLSCISAIDVLNWVMDNTKAEAVRGLLEWAGNGIHFRETQLHHDKELVDENWSLETLYQEKVYADQIARVIKSKACLYLKECVDALVDQICRRGFVYGIDDVVCISSHTDECERELQVEEEIQVEPEVEHMTCLPSKEKVWKYANILHATSVEDLHDDIQVMEMTTFIRQWISPKELTDLAWTKSRIYGTENFFSTIKAQSSLDRLNVYLRRIDVVLVFQNDQILLVSECEADHILALLWSYQDHDEARSCGFSFMNYAFGLHRVVYGDEEMRFQEIDLVRGCRLNRKVPRLAIIACHVYNGETMVETNEEAVECLFRAFLAPLAQREVALSNFVCSRGNSHKWMRSFLHELCYRMDLEESTCSCGKF